ncbi:MAG: hypothetical protein Q9191_006207 [Dirinaria sp. TL-2023a]
MLGPHGSNSRARTGSSSGGWYSYAGSAPTLGYSSYTRQVQNTASLPRLTEEEAYDKIRETTEPTPLWNTHHRPSRALDTAQQAMGVVEAGQASQGQAKIHDHASRQTSQSPSPYKPLHAPNAVPQAIRVAGISQAQDTHHEEQRKHRQKQLERHYAQVKTFQAQDRYVKEQRQHWQKQLEHDQPQRMRVAEISQALARYHEAQEKQLEHDRAQRPRVAETSQEKARHRQEERKERQKLMEQDRAQVMRIVETPQAQDRHREDQKKHRQKQLEHDRAQREEVAETSSAEERYCTEEKARKRRIRNTIFHVFPGERVYAKEAAARYKRM